MAYDKLVDSAALDSSLTSIANAIRTKGGTSASLAFPADFVSAINAISGGGNTFTKSTFTIASATSFRVFFTSALQIAPTAQNEILIWNIKGTGVQSGGSVATKYGVVVTQNGAVVTNSAVSKRSASVVAPDSMTPSSSWTNDTALVIVDGYYTNNLPSNNPGFNIGGGNTFEVLQIPYDIGWYIAT